MLQAHLRTGGEEDRAPSLKLFLHGELQVFFKIILLGLEALPSEALRSVTSLEGLLETRRELLRIFAARAEKFLEFICLLRLCSDVSDGYTRFAILHNVFCFL